VEGAQHQQNDSKFLLGYSNVSGLGHSQERLVELSTQVARMLNGLASLWQVDVTGIEMAITFEAKETQVHD
jgi:hypothetical protein